MGSTEFWLSEEQYARLAPLLPNDTRGVARVDDPVPTVDGDVRLVAEGRHRNVDQRLSVGSQLRLREFHRSTRVGVLLARPGGLVGPCPSSGILGQIAS